MAVAKIATAPAGTAGTDASSNDAPVKKGRGLSFDEKRKRLAEFLLGKKDFFQLKDLEKQVPKATGIVTQSVKEVLQSLVDDRLVNAEKIGISNYFWSFPSTAMQSREQTRRKLRDELERVQETRSRLEGQLSDAQASRQDTSERTVLLQRFAALQETRAMAAAKLEQHRLNDPKLLAARRSGCEIAKAAANRWTDNIFTLQSYCVSNFSLSRSQFDEQFGVPEDFDYI